METPMSARRRRSRQYHSARPQQATAQTRTAKQANNSNSSSNSSSSSSSLTVLSEALAAVLAREGATLEDMERLSETTAALHTLKQVAPSLHRHPELLAEIQQVLTTVEARATALTGLTLKASPTGASPVATLANNGNGLWTGSKDTAIGVPNAAMLRQFADKNPWVQAARTTRKQQIGRSDIAVEPMDVRGSYNTGVQRTVQALLSYPNEYRDSYRSLMGTCD